ncbi:NAD(P)/FAD-dependent oxidoreductase [Bdellovibrio sp. HCB2-146]|uniref:NAD(P)/FAD-dependent oxidoreductase n=1 Tax=Bdellovibrio sp. HCB2-146 TaxID=3394362 RepID=UPI0039BD0EC7
MQTKTVVIVGGGFAGLSAAKVLANKPEVEVILIDQRNHHLFQPLLYQVATAGLNPSDIAVPIRGQFPKAPNVEVHLGRIENINLREKYLQIPEGKLSFDYLILACGAQHSYFGNPQWEDFAPGLKSVEQATEIRRRILTAFEEAENEISEERQKELLTFVIVGGGPTGVELAGAIADISRTVLVKDFNRINPASAHVILLEAGPRILASFDEKLSAQAKSDLETLGVDVRLGARVMKIDGSGVQVGNDWIAAKAVFWAAGVKAAKMHLDPTVELDRAGRIKVKGDFSVPGFPSAFVVGDMASFEMSAGKFLPGLAPAAIQGGKYVAQVILNEIRGRARGNSFQYLDKGQMATIGKKKAIAQAKFFKMTGFLAWVAWLYVHILYLISFKNKFSVFLQWSWSYLFSKRGARLITERDWKLKD